MSLLQQLQRRLSLPFLLVLAAVYAAALLIVRVLPALPDARLVASAVTLDLVVIVPAAYFVLVVRKRNVSALTLAPVVVLSLVAASQIVPPEHHQLLSVMHVGLAPLELGLIGWIVWRARRAWQTAEERLDPLERLQLAARDVLKNERAAAIFASEIAVLYYGLFAWRAAPHVPAGCTAITHHRSSGRGGIVFGLLVLFACEGAGAHFLLMRWSPLVAWISTIGTAYGALWLLADLRASILRPILIDAELVTVRSGLRCMLRVPREKIVAIESKDPELGKQSLDLTLLGTPTHWLLFAEPLTAELPYGFTRQVRAIGVQPDDVDRFEAVLVDRGSTEQ
ncbi:MAG: hypothetical protein RL885_22495 [Planctomycetota bacterium]